MLLNATSGAAAFNERYDADATVMACVMAYAVFADQLIDFGMKNARIIWYS
jgi:hypothetical protein